MPGCTGWEERLASEGRSSWWLFVSTRSGKKAILASKQGADGTQHTPGPDYVILCHYLASWDVWQCDTDIWRQPSDLLWCWHLPGLSVVPGTISDDLKPVSRGVPRVQSTDHHPQYSDVCEAVIHLVSGDWPPMPTYSQIFIDIISQQSGQAGPG